MSVLLHLYGGWDLGLLKLSIVLHLLFDAEGKQKVNGTCEQPRDRIRDIQALDGVERGNLEYGQDPKNTEAACPCQ